MNAVVHGVQIFYNSPRRHQHVQPTVYAPLRYADEVIFGIGYNGYKKEYTRTAVVMTEAQLREWNEVTAPSLIRGYYDHKLAIVTTNMKKR